MNFTLHLYKTLAITTLFVATAQWFRYDGGSIQLWVASFIVWVSLVTVGTMAVLIMTFGSRITPEKIIMDDDEYVESVKFIKTDTDALLIDYKALRRRMLLALIAVFVVMAASFARSADTFETLFLAISLALLYTGASRAIIVYDIALKRQRQINATNKANSE